MHFTRSATGHGEVLAGEMNQPPIYHCASRDHSIRRQFFFRHAKVSGTMLCESADLLEAFPIDQFLHALACRQQPRRVMFFNALPAAAQFDLGSLVA